MKRYAVVIETTDTGYGAYVPDLPGCVAAGATYEETDRLIRKAIPFHIEGLRRMAIPYLNLRLGSNWWTPKPPPECGPPEARRPDLAARPVLHQRN